MKYRSLLHTAKRSFKLFGKKDKPETLDEILKGSKNLAYLTKEIKEKNKALPRLLPPKDPKSDNKLTVVFQLDQTIAYTFSPDQEGYLLAPFRKYDHYCDYLEYQTYLSIYKRKNLDMFLDYVSKQCEAVLWTTSVKSYTDLVMGFLDKDKKIPVRFTQEHCDTVKYDEQDIDEFVKDLNLLGRDMRRVVYIDSRAFGFWMEPDNCLVATQFKADDTQLEDEDMEPFIELLEELRAEEDVREYLKDRYCLRKILESAKLL